MGIKKLETATIKDVLKDALMSMEVGETRTIAEAYSKRGVTAACSRLKKYGYVFITSNKLGTLTITRLQ